MAREQFQTLTEPMYYILLALMDECCGVDIMGKVAEISEGRVEVGPGTLYAALARFEENQVIMKTNQEGRKKWYLITDKGREMIQQENIRMQQMLEQYQRQSRK